MGRNGLFLGLGKSSNTGLGSTHVVEQLSFSVFLSILTFDFDLILLGNLHFFGPILAIFGVGVAFDNHFGLGSTHAVQQLSFSMFSSILTFDFYLFWDIYFSFGGPNELFLGLG